MLGLALVFLAAAAGAVIALLMLPEGTAPVDLTLERFIELDSDEARVHQAELVRQVEAAGVDHVIFADSRGRTMWAFGVVVDDPEGLQLVGFPDGLVTVFGVPADFELRDGSLWLPVPDDLPACEDVTDGMCRWSGGTVEYLEEGCRFAPTTFLGNFRNPSCSL